MNYTIYDPTSGQISHVLSTHDLDQAAINLVDTHYVEGLYSGDKYYIDQGQVCAIPDDPSEFLRPHTFNFNSKTWDLDLIKTQQHTRQHRNQLLSIVDRVNPIWYNSLTVEQQQALAVYRQHLLDVPQQTGFPESVEWPAKPTWL